MSLETIDIAAIFGSLGVILSLTACVAGVGWRTWAKYHDKIMSGEAQAFDRKFLYQALVAFGGSVVIALPLVTAGTEMINEWAGSVGLLIAWLLTAGWAYAFNDGTNGVIKLVENKGIERAVKSGKLDKVIQERMKVLQQEKEKQEQSSPTTTETPPSNP